MISEKRASLYLLTRNWSPWHPCNTITCVMSHSTRLFKARWVLLFTWMINHQHKEGEIHLHRPVSYSGITNCFLEIVFHLFPNLPLHNLINSSSYPHVLDSLFCLQCCERRKKTCHHLFDRRTTCFETVLVALGCLCSCIVNMLKD